MCIFLAVLMFLGLTACGQKEQETPTEEGFTPSLDTSITCNVNVAGGYDNFEAFEAR